MKENINPEIPETNLSEDNVYIPVKIENELASNMLEMAKWAKYLSYVGFLLCAYSLLHFLRQIMSDSNNYHVGRGIVGLIGVALYFIPFNFLYKASLKFTEGIINSNNEKLILASQNIKSHFKFIGVYAVIAFAVMVLAFVITIGAKSSSL